MSLVNQQVKYSLFTWQIKIDLCHFWQCTKDRWGVQHWGETHCGTEQKFQPTKWCRESNRSHGYEVSVLGSMALTGLWTKPFPTCRRMVDFFIRFILKRCNTGIVLLRWCAYVARKVTPTYHGNTGNPTQVKTCCPVPPTTELKPQASAHMFLLHQYCPHNTLLDECLQEDELQINL